MASSTNNLVQCCYLQKNHIQTAKKNAFKAGFLVSGSRNGKFLRQSFKVKANVGSSGKGVETVNGKKVNGVHLGDQRGIGVKDCSFEEPDDRGVLLGRFVENRFVYRQTFVIRSYEIGPDKTATMETLMNLLQETALNHVTSAGLAGNGFGATHEMSLRKLIWVVTRIQVQVEKYSSWGDVVEIDTWVNAAGKNGMRRDWIIRDFVSQKIITRATSTWVIMNRETRRLSKIPDEVRNEVTPFYLDRSAIATEKIDHEKIEKLTDETAARIRPGLAPSWSDMDANQHVNNVKYIGWILESVPMKVLEEYNMGCITLEYRRECRQSDMLDSLTSMKTRHNKSTTSNAYGTTPTTPHLECTHLLRMQHDTAEIVRARTVWISKY
ncbi:palmitoyl-acyl carrier protein thioesterase, chloroplastic-like [Cynara cardunculus var. scolymus]|uniref:palmitoyl-acyl carrier protein thioesterase, chloroplastic-like n=1 Tax=Cynara cardunculus var. scolymus TaxID=59895 RepID=UPI000D62C239|nr:palmitoyl-acyl carrier protein thioesterase, chloroplastic-like [Cynara cardunculus var. scolymus]